MEDPTVQSSCVSSHQIKWLFIAELFLWRGGFSDGVVGVTKVVLWVRGFSDRVVGVTKVVLKKNIGKLRPIGVQFQIIPAEIEAILNSRLLVYLNDDRNNQVVITPIHFLSTNVKNG